MVAKRRLASAWSALLTLLFSTASLPGRADHLVSAADLLQVCRDPVGEIECSTYIAGVLDGYLVGSFVGSGNISERPLICLPQNTLRAELVSSFVTFMEANPDLLTVGGGVAVFSAFRRAFPCVGDRPRG